MGKERIFYVLGHLALIFHYRLEITLHLLIHIFLHMLPVFLLCCGSFLPFPGKQQQGVMPEWPPPPADHLQSAFARVAPAQALATLQFSASAVSVMDKMAGPG